MGIREAINKHQGLAANIAIVVVLIGIFLVYRSTGTAGGGGLVSQRYYTVDDGKTYFADDVDKIVPYTHEGKEAVLAHVYNCGGTISVHYVSRLTEAGRKWTAANAGDPDASPDPSVQMVEYKRPGETTWQAQPIVAKCPNGEYPEMVNP